ncbi:protein NUCLEAR FUSION DEFECTIVE 6, mitochondrial isoform X3 [Spinacia oleracea]|uniref:Protein NUCLEAR FUSION DEFECTIVE 6, mitochondrial isoform X3 n=1 Tax=Spinacia oleracea TaxID=3562 RepID=A0A9R0JQC7_SPIOL|nr:protein NUCLEAR FUSION DEFECTIVE 6, mitochondrial-like isoform X3 [Spinacia oleracea]
MATVTAARSIYRSTSVRSAAAKFASVAKSARSPFRASSVSNSLSRRIFRCPVELSACVETMRPFHTATASALMTSMLSVSCHTHGWVSDGNATRLGLDLLYVEPDTSSSLTIGKTPTKGCNLFQLKFVVFSNK